jgi:hypothetical protein
LLYVFSWPLPPPEQGSLSTLIPADPAASGTLLPAALPQHQPYLAQAGSITANKQHVHQSATKQSNKLKNKKKKMQKKQVGVPTRGPGKQAAAGHGQAATNSR